jgi:hypothetical protein
MPKFIGLLIKKRNFIIISLIIFPLAGGGWLTNQWRMKNIMIETDSPDYGMVSIINESRNPVKNIRGIVRADFSYADKGFITYPFTVNELAPQDRFIVHFDWVKDDVDIGRIDVWLSCNGGKLHYVNKWSYAYAWIDKKSKIMLISVLTIALTVAIVITVLVNSRKRTPKKY